MKRLSLLLAFLLLLGCFAACAPAKEDERSETSPPEETGDVPPLTDDFQGKTFEFGIIISAHSSGEDARSSIIAPEEDADLVDVAVRERNEWVEENLECKIDVGYIAYNNWTAVRTDIKSGDCTFDTMLLPFDSTCTTYLTEGLYADMKKLNLRLDEEYWNQQANESLELLGKQYAVVSDISYYAFNGYAMVAFNRAVEAELMREGLITKDFYSMVNDKEWTLDKMTEVARLAVEDIDGGGISFATDRFGISTNLSMIRLLMVAGDEGFVETKEDGKPVATVDGRGFEYCFTKIFDLYADRDLLACTDFESTDWRELTYLPLQEDRLLFLISTLPSSMAYYMEAGEYAYLPMPKNNEGQERYLTPVSAANGLVMGMPISVSEDDYAFVTAVLNTMAYRSYLKVNDAFYSRILGYDTVQDNEAIEMLRIVRNGVTFDYALAFNFADCCDTLDKIVRRGVNTFASTYHEMQDRMTDEILDLRIRLNTNGS